MLNLHRNPNSNIKVQLWYDGQYYQMFGAGHNNTYAEIPEAEISNATLATGRLVSGRRLVKIKEHFERNVPNPTAPNHSANKKYVDEKVASVSVPDVSGLATKQELQNGLQGKANANHSHSINGVSGLQDVLNTKQSTAQKNQANGYVGLDANKKIDPALLPVIATVETVVVANKSARLALTTTQVQKGDCVVQSDNGERWVLSGTTPSSESHWTLVADITPEWSQIANKPTAYTPASHTHTKDQVGLGNVDNTSDATKNTAPAMLTNKTINGDVNTITKVNSLKNLNENTELKVWAGTQQQYDAIVTKDPNTLYLIKDT
ncbi:MAG: hypothetical protein Q4B28_05005 [bacterium]|nr:hypothetical protein [bacterium]